jgi:hypothetical protein
VSYQQVTVTLTCTEEDAEIIQLELEQQLEILSEEHTIRNQRVEIEDCDDPDDELYEDAA